MRDYRGGGRSSARETAMRVAAGPSPKSVGRQGRCYPWLSLQLGPIAIDRNRFDWDEVANNPFFSPDAEAAQRMECYMDELRKEGNSIGARISVQASGVPVGLGEPVFDRPGCGPGARLMSINAVKGVEIGDGFAVVNQKGSEHRDEMTPEGFLSNHAGGILGGSPPARPSSAYRPQTHLQPAFARSQHQRVGGGGRGGDPGAARSLRGHPGNPHRGGDDGDRAAGPSAA